ncbi:hypothetical protein CF326_g8652 [Tilletia indica]|nr:hypothetical protein CF326_g8652 [Tilletia indica]
MTETHIPRLERSDAGNASVPSAVESPTPPPLFPPPCSPLHPQRVRLRLRPPQPRSSEPPTASASPRSAPYLVSPPLPSTPSSAPLATAPIHPQRKRLQLRSPQQRPLATLTPAPSLLSGARRSPTAPAQSPAVTPAPDTSTRPAFGSVAPAAGLDPTAIWSSLSEEDEPSADLSGVAAREITARDEVALRLTPARRLLVAVHGTADPAVVRAQCLVPWKSVKSKTRASYGRDILVFLAWCDDIGLPAYARLPTAANILLLYLQEDMARLRPGTIENRSHALAYWHRVQRLPWALSGADARTLKKAARIECLPPLEKRRPVRLNDLVVIVERHDPMDRAHVAIVAAALLAFYAMCRPGEFTVRSAADPHADRPRWTHILEHAPTTPGGLTSFSLHLPSDKTHGKGGFDRIAAEQRRMPQLCPVAAMRRHLALNAPNATEEGAAIGAFSYQSMRGGRRELTEGLFIKTINRWLIEATRERVTGHCFRIGGATLFFGAQKPLDEIRQRGGWESDTYLIYIRDNFVRHAAMFGDIDPTGLFYG